MADRNPLHPHYALALTQSQGWREVVLPYLLGRLTQHERLEAVPTMETPVRLDAVARKHEVLHILQWLYKVAETPSPFEEAMLMGYALTLPKPEEPLVAPLPSATPSVAGRRRTAGSIA